jgi:hypothetical protein
LVKNLEDSIQSREFIEALLEVHRVTNAKIAFMVAKDKILGILAL